MPNWCENKLEVSINVSGKKNIEDAKKQLKDFKVKCFKEGQFDFNKVIPMPESLNITCGTGTDNAIAILEYEMGNKSKIKAMLEWTWVKEDKEINTVKDLYEHLKKDTSIKEIREGRDAIANIEEFGCKDWYDWSCKYWGTKWNASNTYVKEIKNNYINFKFETAWSPPLPILESLMEQYPMLKFSLSFEEPGMGFKGKCGGCLYNDTWMEEFDNNFEIDQDEEVEMPKPSLN